MLKRQFSALVPAFDPRPGRTNVQQTTDLEIPPPGIRSFIFCDLILIDSRLSSKYYSLKSKILLVYADYK